MSDSAMQGSGLAYGSKLPMRSYWGIATLIVGEESFEIECALDEGQGPAGPPVSAGFAMYGKFSAWGGYFRLLDPSRDAALHAALSEYPAVTLRVPDGRQASAIIIHGDTIQSADSGWLE